MVGITSKFVKSAMTENLLKYNSVNGNVPTCALNENAMNKKTYLNTLFSIFNFEINVSIKG
jgi:hypothetical protein